MSSWARGHLCVCVQSLPLREQRLYRMTAAVPPDRRRQDPQDAVARVPEFCNPEQGAPKLPEIIFIRSCSVLDMI